VTQSDRELGMHRPIARRDFLNGASVAVGSTMIRPPSVDAEEFAQPPALRMSTTRPR